jgi:hypothetical protein
MSKIKAYGPGSLIVTRTDIPNQTPINIGYAQEFSYDFKGETKTLHGSNQFPIAVRRGTMKVTGKIKAAVISGLAWNAAFFGQSFTDGSTKMVPTPGESFTLGTAATPKTISSISASGTTATLTSATAHGLLPGASITIAGATPSAYNGTFTVLTAPSSTTLTFTTLTAPGGVATVVGTYTVNTIAYTTVNAANFDTDLGVVYASSTDPLQRVADNPATGQYCVDASTGVYHLAAGDTGIGFRVAYAYSDASAGQTLTISNQPIGTTPTFQIDYATTDNGQTIYVRFYQAIGADMKIAHKLTEFVMPEFDVEMFCNDADELGTIGLPSKS